MLHSCLLHITVSWFILLQVHTGHISRIFLTGTDSYRPSLQHHPRTVTTCPLGIGAQRGDQGWSPDHRLSDLRLSNQQQRQQQRHQHLHHILQNDLVMLPACRTSKVNLHLKTYPRSNRSPKGLVTLDRKLSHPFLLSTSQTLNSEWPWESLSFTYYQTIAVHNLFTTAENFSYTYGMKVHDPGICS